MSVKKITQTICLCTCDLPDCSGIDPKTHKPKPWKSLDQEPPERCRWCGRRTWNGNDQRRNLFITANGKTQRLIEWANETGLSKPLIRARLKFGWTEQEAVTIPPGGKRSKS